MAYARRFVTLAGLPMNWGDPPGSGLRGHRASGASSSAMGGAQGILPGEVGPHRRGSHTPVLRTLPNPIPTIQGLVRYPGPGSGPWTRPRSRVYRLALFSLLCRVFVVFSP